MKFKILAVRSETLEGRRAIFFTAAAAALGLLLVLPLGSPAAAQSVCLTLDTEQQRATYPIVVGDSLHLSFGHSIYGSEVEEQFQITPGGFRANKLRYAELRLVEFYGHESATNEDGWWIVHNPGREFTSLDLRASHESSLRITFLDQTISLRSDTAIDGRARLSVSACPKASHG
ncbi:MAG TPA: DUF1850 domain-containing protein [Candidatus Binatia bacterium]|nr:DUF1850 domain-containing protein [Candidatus Binatia bacterium]